MRLINNPFMMWSLVAALGMAIFLVDTLVPLGIAGGVPYILVVLVALWLPHSHAVLLTASVCTVLTVLGYFFSPAGGESAQVLTNRALAIFAIFATAILGMQLKRGHDRLTDFQTRLHLAFDATNEGAWDWNLETDEVIFSDAWCQALGYTANEITPHRTTWDALVHPDDRATFYRRLAEHDRNATFECEMRLHTKGGSWRWTLSRGSVVAYNSQGRATRMIGIDLNITSHKQAQQREALQKTILERIVNGDAKPHVLNHLCAYVEQLVPSAGCSVMLLDPETRVLNVVAAPSALGVVSSRLNGLTPGEHAGGCGTAVYTGKPVIIADTETDERWDSMRKRADGLHIRACWSFPIVTEANNPVGSFGLSLPHSATPSEFEYSLLETACSMAGIILQQATVKEQQQKSEERYRDLHDTAPLSYVTCAMDGKILSVNSRMTELLGLSAADLVQHEFLNFFAPTAVGATKAQRLLAEVRAGRDIFDEELEMQRADGSIFWVGLTLRIHRDIHGHPLEYRGMIQDITERKQAEFWVNDQRALLEMIARGHVIEDIMARLCLMVEAQAPGTACAVYSLDGMVLHLCAAPHLPTAMQEAITSLDVGPQSLCSGTAVYRRETVVAADMTRDPLWIQHAPLATAHGFHACWATPMLSSTHSVSGVFEMYSATPREPSDRHRRLVAQAIDLANIAIENVRAHTAVRHSEARYRTLYDDNPTMYFTVTKKGVILSVNRFGAQQLGYEPQELVGLQICHVIHPDDHEHARAHLRQSWEEATDVTRWETRKRRKDGSQLWVRETARMLNKDQHDAVLLIVCEDITELKLAEDMLSQNERTIRQLHEITSAEQHSFEQRVRELLKLGCERFGQPLGILTRRIDDELEIVFLHTDRSDILEGARFPLTDSFCGQSMLRGQPLAIPHAGESEWRTHPAYLALRLEAYVGVPVTAGDTVYGAVSFTGFTPARSAFSESDLDFLKLMSRWIGNELDRQHTAEALRAHEQALCALYTITASHGDSFEARVRQLLELGCSHLQLSVGLFNEIHDDELTWKVVHDPSGAFVAGQSHLLRDTLCQPVVDAAQPVTIQCATHELWSTHPVARQMEMRSYIGTSIKIGTELYGTICFADAEPRRTPFSTAEQDFLQLIALWLGTELERRQGERALKDLNFALSHAMPAISKLDAHGCFTYANTTYATMLGYEPHELLGQPWQLTLAPDELRIPNDAYEQMCLHGEAEYEARTIRKNGTTVYTHVMLIEEVNAKGEHIGHHRFMRDISERKIGEEALRESEGRLQAVLDNSTAVIYVKDLQKNYLLVNRSYETLFHVTREKVKGKSDFDIFPAAIAQNFTTNDDKVLATGEPVMQEEIAPHDDGLHTYLSNKFLLRNTQGLPYAICGISTDITARKRAEETLRAMVEGTSSVGDHDIIRSLALHLADALHVRNVCIAEYVDEHFTHAHSLAITDNGRIEPDVEFPLRETPHHNLSPTTVRVMTQDIQQRFPTDNLLQQCNAHVYLGIQLQDVEQRPLGILAVLHDSTFAYDAQTESMFKVFASRIGAELARVRVEQDLQKSEERYRSLVDHAPICIHELDLKGSIQSINHAWLRTTNTTDEHALIGMRYTDIAAQEDQLRLERLLERAQRGEPSTFEHNAYIGGDLHTFEASFIPIQNQLGHITKLMGITHDITEAKRANEQLREAYARTRELKARLEAIEESERKRIARELHDEFGQMLTGLKFDIAWVYRRITEHLNQKEDAPIIEKIQAMSQMTDELIRTVRRIATSLRPSILDDLGLVPALEWQARDFEARTGVPCHFTTSPHIPSIQFDNERATALFRIAQELFTNVTRYADATEVNLALNNHNGSVTLTMQDDGKGISSADIEGSTSLGLLGIKERVTLLNGSFSIQGTPGEGTCASVSLPLPETPLP